MCTLFDWWCDRSDEGVRQRCNRRPCSEQWILPFPVNSWVSTTHCCALLCAHCRLCRSLSSILYWDRFTTVICTSDRPITPSDHHAGELSEGKTIWEHCAFHNDFQKMSRFDLIAKTFSRGMSLKTYLWMDKPIAELQDTKIAHRNTLNQSFPQH